MATNFRRAAKRRDGHLGEVADPTDGTVIGKPISVTSQKAL